MNYPQQAARYQNKKRVYYEPQQAAGNYTSFAIKIRNYHATSSHEIKRPIAE